MVSHWDMPTLWVLVANRERARLFESPDSIRRAVPTETFHNPEGRLKNRDLTSDRDGASRAEAGGNGRGTAGFPRHGGLVNKDEAATQDRIDFARELAAMLDKAYAEHRFGRLILVAAPKLLGDLRDALAPSTSKAIVNEYDKDLIPVDEPEMTRRVRELPEFRAA